MKELVVSRAQRSTRREAPSGALQTGDLFTDTVPKTPDQRRSASRRRARAVPHPGHADWVYSSM